MALYDYRDLDDPYEAKSHCDFETCTLETFSKGLDEIDADGGGDDRESLLSSSFKVMKDLKWKLGSTKSLVVITDAGFLSPDRDGITLSQVVSLSKTIDPVNFYVVTTGSNIEAYSELTQLTDGKVVTSVDELNELTDFIMERYDSLPRVEEDSSERDFPILEVADVAWLDSSTAKIRFNNTGIGVIVTFNDVILGITEDTEIILNEIDSSVSNSLTLTPVTDDARGDAVTIQLTAPDYMNNLENNGESEASAIIPRAPDTGRA